jgi:hypothetical protein
MGDCGVRGVHARRHSRGPQLVLEAPRVITGSAEVQGQLGCMVVQLLVVKGRERGARAGMRPRPPRPGELLVDRLADERMREGIAPRPPPGLDDHVLGQRGVHRVQHLLILPVCHALERGELEVPSQHRRRREDVADGLVEGSQPPQQQVLDALRQCLREGSVTSVELAHHLLDEERVALRSLGEGLHLVWIELRAVAPHELRDAVAR